MIDDKPVKSEIKLLKAILEKMGNISNNINHVLGNVFGFFKKMVFRERSKLYELRSDRFIGGCADVIEDLLYRNDKGIIVTFDFRTRELADELVHRHIEIEKKLYFIDAVSYNQGKGSPPVPNVFCINRPDDFENIFCYTVIPLDRIKTDSAFVLMVAPYSLMDYTDINEIGVFLKWYTDELEKRGIPVIFIYKEHEDDLLKMIILRLVRNRKEVI